MPEEHSAEGQERLQQNAEQVATDIVDKVRSSASSTQQALDDGISAASDAVKTGAAQATAQYGKVYGRSQELLETSKAHSQAALDTAFGHLRDGVHMAMEHPTASYAIGIGAAVLVVPGTRRLLWRQTLGRFRSEEAIFRSAETKAVHLGQSIEGHSAEAKKLSERLVAAQEQYAAGLSKLKATNRQLQTLQSSVQATERKATALIDNLRELSGPQALKLRASVAIQLGNARRQSSILDKEIYSLSKKGF